MKKYYGEATVDGSAPIGTTVTAQSEDEAEERLEERIARQARNRGYDVSVEDVSIQEVSRP